MYSYNVTFFYNGLEQNQLPCARQENDGDVNMNNKRRNKRRKKRYRRGSRRNCKRIRRNRER